MKKIQYNELSKELQKLVDVALSARNNAYAPYSKYKVGAAVLTDKGNIYAGCNVERVTLSQTTHAERNSVDTMVVHGERNIKALCCVALNAGIPCAECRQTIWEFCKGDPNVTIIGADLEKNITITTIGELYPFPFGPEELGIVPQDN